MQKEMSPDKRNLLLKKDKEIAFKNDPEPVNCLIMEDLHGHCQRKNQLKLLPGSRHPTFVFFAGRFA